MTTLPDTIEIRRLRVPTHIGVPDEELATLQTLWLTIQMVPQAGFNRLDDDISRTIDYHAVSLEIKTLAAAKPRRLIETLAVDAAEWLLANHSLERVSITIEKHILPDTECVAVHIVRP